MVEGLAFDSLLASDHVYIENQIPDCLTTAAYFAGQTTRIRVGTAVMLPALREPRVTAKQIATLDHLSGGRLDLGVGVGGEFPKEWAALGVSRTNRGARTDEYLAMFREVWSGASERAFDGRFVSFGDVNPSPLPVQPGGPPILVGGRSDAALQRAARHDGWIAYLESTSGVARKVSTLAELGVESATFRVAYCPFAHVDPDRDRARSTMEAALGQRYGQDFSTFVDKFCAIGTPDDVRQRIEQYLDAGVNEIVFMPQAPAGGEQMLDQVAALGEIVAAIRANDQG